MAIISKDDLTMLIGASGDQAVSIYMPTQRSGDIQQNPIRFKNILDKAEVKLVENGMRAPSARLMLEPARRLLQDVFFWQQQSDGLTAFILPGSFRVYRLPYSFPEVLAIASRFQIKPLLKLLSNDRMFYVLAISQNRARLFQCTRYNIQQLNPENLPKSLSEALSTDDWDRQRQFHFHNSTSSLDNEVIYSHGPEVSEGKKTDILRYFHKVDHGLREYLGDDNSPVIIAAVKYLHPIYQQANTLPHLLGKGIEGNPDEINAEKLHQQAWNVAGILSTARLAEKVEQQKRELD